MNCTLQDIVASVAAANGITTQKLMTTSREAKLAKARQIAMWMARDMTKLSLPDIGARMGKMRENGKPYDHTTIMYGVREVGQRINADPTLLPAIRKIQKAALQRASERFRGPTISYERAAGAASCNPEHAVAQAVIDLLAA